MAKLIPVEDGKKFHLEQLQTLLGGDIEILPAFAAGYCLVVLEDGKRLNLLVNDVASALSRFPLDPIVGPALYCSREHID